MMPLKKGGRRCGKTSAPGTGTDKDNAAGDNLLLGIIVIPARAFVNPLSVVLCSLLHRGRP